MDNAREILEEIGSRLSDVFGADAVIWVEGPTEEECFPLLLKAAEMQMPAGTIIARLRGTGDLEGKRAKACADIYLNLSAAGSILPRNVKICVDGDKRNDRQVANLEAVFRTTVSFLPREMYECYLLHPRGIAALLNTLPSFKDHQVGQEVVEAWINAEGNAPKYRASEAAVLSNDWLRSVDAAHLLGDLFETLSDAKESYRKTAHSPQLTRWLIEHDRAFLEELLAHVKTLFQGAISRRSA